MDGIAISICPSRKPRLTPLPDAFDLAIGGPRESAAGARGSDPGVVGPLSLPPSSCAAVPPLRPTFMSKCYLIDRHLQMRRSAKSSCGLRHNSSQGSIEDTIYVFFMRPAGMSMRPRYALRPHGR